MKRLYTNALIGFLFLVGIGNSVYGQQFSYNGINFSVTKSSGSGVDECKVDNK